MSCADAHAQRDRAIQELTRNDGDLVGRVRILCEADPPHRHDEREDAGAAAPPPKKPPPPSGGAEGPPIK